ncbi:hypothetical protein EEX84_09230 [Planococcus salinus]|uniref:Uncharacterized protein n=1 Tax=Planococcus salinus TaxID=1848460 RepID=A0A3M8P7P6_9BACL|nr:hypothetical protein EEX84_09230 [Planococcus salinus]
MPFWVAGFFCVIIYPRPAPVSSDRLPPNSDQSSMSYDQSLLNSDEMTPSSDVGANGYLNFIFCRHSRSGWLPFGF